MSKAKHAHPHTHAERQSKNASDGEGEKQEQMCCDGSGRTAEEHRKESADGKCCVDS
jgi:hypothetical protein